MKKRFTEEQIIGFLREAEAGMPVAELYLYLIDKALSERKSLRFVGMNPSSIRYRPVTDRNSALKERIVTLAQRHRRYRAGMIYLKLRQAGEIVN